MRVTKKWIVLPATMAVSLSGLAVAQQSRDRDNESAAERQRREQREERLEQREERLEQRQERREERRTDAETGPQRIEQAVQARYPKAKVTRIGQGEQNGVQTYLLRIETDQGETSARVTERGDFLFLGYPGVTQATLPRPVTSLLEGMFNGRPETVQKYENTTYLVNADFGNRAYQLRMDAIGRLIDAKPQSEVKREDPAQYPRASRSDEDSLQPRLKDYFNDPKVKAVHRYPEADGFFWVNLSTATEDDVWVLMDAKREVAEYRTRVSGNDVPQPVTRAMREFFKGAKPDAIYRDNEIRYNVLQPVGEEAVLLSLTPLGDIVRIRQASGSDVRREFAEREPNELFRSRDRNRDRDRDDADRGSSNRTPQRNRDVR